MIIESVRYHNFMGFGEEDNILDFDTIFKEDEMLLVIGIRDGDPKHSNGAGKSTLVEGICYGFFGRLPRIVAENSDRKGEVAKEIIRTDDNNVFVAGESFVEIKFKTGDGRSWRLRRGRKINKKRDGHSRILELDCSDESVGGRRNADAEKSIGEVLGFSFESLVNSCMFAQRDSGKFLSGSDTARKDLFIELVGVQIVAKMLSNVRRRKSDLSQKHIQLGTKINVLKDRLLQTGVADPAAQKKTWEDEIKIVDGRVKAKEEEISQISDSSLKNAYELLHDEVAAVHARLEEVSSAYNRETEPLDVEERRCSAIIELSQKEIKHISEMKKRLQQEFDSLVSKIVDDERLAEMRRVLDEAHEKVKLLTTKEEEVSREYNACVEMCALHSGTIKGAAAIIDSIREFLKTGKKGAPCPSCGSQWSEESAAEEIARQQKIVDDTTPLTVAQSRLAELKNELQEIRGQQNAAKQTASRESDYTRIKSESEGAAARSEKIKKEAAETKLKEVEEQKRIEEARARVTVICSERSAVNEKYAKLIESATLEEAEKKKKSTEAHEKMMSRAEEISTFRRELDTLNRDKSRIAQQLAGLAVKIEQIEKDQSEFRDVSREFTGIDGDLNRLLVLEDVMSRDGFKMRLAEKYVPHLSRYASEFCSLLSPDMSLNIYMENDAINIVVEGANSSDYLMCSGGEKAVIRLALNMANSMISIGGNADLPGVVLLDEIFECLDPMHRRNVFMLLERLNEYFPKIVVITHDSTLQSGFSSRLVVAKEGKVSRIVGVQKVQSVV